jgi:hypothetical protein
MEIKELEDLLAAMSKDKGQVGGEQPIDYRTASLEDIKNHIVEGMGKLNWGLKDIERIEAATVDRQQDVKDMIAYFKGMFLRSS